MTALLTETFEGGTNGATMTTGNTAFNNISSSTLTFSNASPKGGTLCGDLLAASSLPSLRYDFGSTRTLAYIRLYLKIIAYPSVLVPICTAFNGATKIADLRLSAVGVCSIRDNSTVVATSGLTLATNTWHRLAWKVDPGNTGQSLSIYAGTNFESALGAQDEKLTGSASNTAQTAVDSMRIGLLSSITSGEVQFDDVQIDDAAEPPATNPVASSVTFAYQVVIG